MNRGEKYTFGNGGIFTLLEKKYKYSVHFIEKVNADIDFEALDKLRNNLSQGKVNVELLSSGASEGKNVTGNFRITSAG